MLTAVFSFLASSAFRMIWGEASAWITARQEQRHEIERLRLQGELDAAQHARNLEAIKVQADLGVKTIQVQAEADLEKIDATGFYDAIREANKPSGVQWVDAWNKSVRPAAASVALALWVLELSGVVHPLTAWDRELCSAILGFFFASREFTKRGR